MIIPHIEGFPKNITILIRLLKKYCFNVYVGG